MSQDLNVCSREIPTHAPAKLQSNNPIKPHSKNRKISQKIPIKAAPTVLYSKLLIITLPIPVLSNSRVLLYQSEVIKMVFRRWKAFLSYSKLLIYGRCGCDRNFLGYFAVLWMWFDRVIGLQFCGSVSRNLSAATVQVLTHYRSESGWCL